MFHTVLGVAEQIRYCDRKANPWFDTPRSGYDMNLDPINCTWGFHRCAGTRNTILLER